MSIIVSAIIIFLLVNVLYFVALSRKDYGLVDMAWGPGFIITTIVFWAQNPFLDWQKGMLFIFLLAWATRLSTYIYFRHYHKEDWRYAEWRKTHGKWANLSAYFQIFLLQACTMLVLASPLFFLFSRDTSIWNIFSYLGTALFIIGFWFEIVADFQLFSFKAKAENKGKVLTRGLWKLCRHPNYFGEVVLWWGIYFFCVPYTNGIWMIYAPALLTFLILKVSGMALVEKRHKNDPEYQKYAKTTSAFIPWPKHK